MDFNSLQFKRGTASEWASANPILKSGEPGFVVDTHTLKVGDGVTPFSVLPSINEATVGLMSVLDDTAPQLGGNLDLNSYLVTGVGGINITGNSQLGGTLNVAGNTTLNDVPSIRTVAVSGDITGSGNVEISGFFIGDGSQLTNLPPVASTLAGNLDGHIDLNNFSVSGVGEIAATTFYGDGSNLTGINTALSGNLDGDINLNNYNVTGSGNINIEGNVTATGNLTIDGSGYIKLPVLSNGDVPAHQEGIIYYDEDSRSLTVYNDEADIALNIGQEFYTRVRNNTGSTIISGQPVYIDGSHGGAAPTVVLADASSEVSSYVAGVATHDIADSNFGYITVHGLIRGLNTSFFSNGEELFLAASGAGILTNVQPVIPNYKTPVAHVVRSHSNNGSIIVEISSPKLGGGDMKSEPNPTVSGVPFVEQLSNDGDSASLKCDNLFTYDESNSKLDVQKTKTNVVMRAYANLATVPSPETWMIVFSTTDNLPVWYDGANWRDFSGNMV